MVMKYRTIVILMYLQQADSLLTGIQQIWHSLPQHRLVSVYGSEISGRCTSIVGDLNNTCNGKSVLNDGIVPILSGVSDNPQSHWATELFTMKRPGAGRITVSFEVEPVTHKGVELAVFNCPELGIHTPVINIYSSSTFRPESTDRMLGNLIGSYKLANSSCSYLITYTMEFYKVTYEPYVNIEFPYVNGSNSSYVFLGEVSFLAQANIIVHCATDSNSGQETDSPTCQVGVAIASTAALTITLMVILSAVIQFAVCWCAYKPKAKSVDPKPKDITLSGNEIETLDDIYETLDDIYESV